MRIGADVGGTFTDVVLMESSGRIWTSKVPSTPPDFEGAVLTAIEQLMKVAGLPGTAVQEVAHGTTVATNAVLERRGAKTALITTRGFRDVLELRRIRAPQLYDLFFEKPKPLVERHLRLELSERISSTGETLVPILEAELETLADRLEKEEVESVAVCFLHAYAFPRHERQVGEFLRQRLPRIQVSLSSEVLPERREYERTATATVNAYVRPLMAQYLNAMRAGLVSMEIDAPLLIMQSAGGLTPASDAADLPVFVLESGPAAGVLAAGFSARRAGIENVITLDMGGTTAKASIIEAGRIAYSANYEVGASLSSGSRLVGGGGELIRAPSIDIAEVGAGGGSIAYLDRAGGLRVGPRSAGAVPGPVCYARGGTEPTVTDANVVLGYIRPGQLADGVVNISLEAARRAVYDRIAAPMGIDLLRAADGIHRIANAQTMRALRQVSTERGRDPREFALIAFGGAGPIHAAGFARDLRIDRTIVPPLPGLFSALGLLFSGVEHHAVRSCLLSGDGLSADAVRTRQDEMRGEMLARFSAEGFEENTVNLAFSVDVRFKGQTSEIRLPLEDERTEKGVSKMCAAFETEHERVYGHRSHPDNPVEVVAVRLIGRAGTRGHSGRLAPAERPGGSEAFRMAFFDGEMVETPVLSRQEVVARRDGPLLIDEYDSTIVVPPDMRVQVDEEGNLVMTPLS